MAITGQLTLNEIVIIEVDADPSVGGVTAPIGSFALLDDKVNGRFWMKSGSGDTSWSIIPRYANGVAFSTGSVVFADSNGFFAQNNSQLFWDNNNSRLGLGVSSPQAHVHIDAGTGVAHSIKFTVGSTTGQTSGDGFDIGVDAAGNAEIRQRESSLVSIFTSNTQAFAITNSQRILLSSSQTSQQSASGEDSHLQVHGTNTIDSQVAVMRWSNDASGSLLRLTKSRGTTIGTHAALQSGDVVGSISMRGSDGSSYWVSCAIAAYADAAFSANSTPGRLSFFTTASSSSSSTERMRIDSGGRVIIASGGAVAQDITGSGAYPIFQIMGTSAVQMAGIQFSADTIGPVFNLLKSRSATLNTQGLVQLDDEFGRIQFRGSDGVNFQAGASIRGYVDGTASTGSMPGRLSLQTTPSGAVTPVERMLIDQTGQVRVIDALRYKREISDVTITATANATTTLSSSSTGTQVFTGTTAGQIVKLPDATTLKIGAIYKIYNSSTNTIAVQNNGGTALDTISTNTGLCSILLTDNSTANGTWVSLANYENYSTGVFSNTQISTTSTSDVLMTSITVTPPAGTYRVCGRATVATTSNNRTVFISLYAGGSQVTNTEVGCFIRTGTTIFTTSDIGNLYTEQFVTVNGSQAIELRWRTSGGTAQAQGYGMSVTKVNS